MWREEKVAKKRDYSNCKFYSVSNNIDKGTNVMLRNKCSLLFAFCPGTIAFISCLHFVLFFAIGSDNFGYHHEIKYSAYSALFFPKFISYYNSTIVIIVFYNFSNLFISS